MSRLRRSHGCPTLALSRFLHPTTFDSFHPRPSSKHISAVGAEQVSPARKGWVHDAKILRSAVGATHSAFVRAPRCRTTKERNREQAKHPRSAPRFNAGTGRIACATKGTERDRRFLVSQTPAPSNLRRRLKPTLPKCTSPNPRISGRSSSPATACTC